MKEREYRKTNFHAKDCVKEKSAKAFLTTYPRTITERLAFPQGVFRCIFRFLSLLTSFAKASSNHVRARGNLAHGLCLRRPATCHIVFSKSVSSEYDIAFDERTRTREHSPFTTTGEKDCNTVYDTVFVIINGKMDRLRTSDERIPFPLKILISGTANIAEKNIFGIFDDISITARRSQAVSMDAKKDRPEYVPRGTSLVTSAQLQHCSLTTE